MKPRLKSRKGMIPKPRSSEKPLGRTPRLYPDLEKMTTTEKFIRDLQRHPLVSAHADNLARMLDAIDDESIDVADAEQLLGAIEWIIAQPDTAEKRLLAIGRLLALGSVEDLNIADFYRLQ
jgi:hypothetical protein